MARLKQVKARRRLRRQLRRDINLASNLGKKLVPEAFEEGGLGRVQDTYGTQANQYLNTLKAQAGTAGQASAEMRDIVARQQAGLEGYESPELQAMREQSERAVDQDYQNRYRQMLSMQARGGVRGAASAAQFNRMARDKMMSQADLEQKMMIENVAERQRRMAQYQGLIEKRDTDLFNRQYQANELYGNRLADRATFERGNQVFNLGQQGREIATRVGAVGTGLGLLGEARTRRERKQAFEDLLNYQREQDAMMQEQMAGML